MSRPWTGVVAALAMLAGGCSLSRDPSTRAVERADHAVAELDRLRPRLAKAGTPGAEELAANLAAVRADLAILPREPIAPVANAAQPAEPFAVRCPDGGCWRLTASGEVAAWRVRLRGGGSQIDDVGPAAIGAAIALERARPFDERGEFGLGFELAAMHQARSGSQHLDLVGVRPLARVAIGLTPQIALTARPILEFGQASVRLGSAPGGVLDRADVYAGFGARVGVRARVGNGDLVAELGWRRCMFQGSASTIDYRVDAYGPEAAVGWGWRF